MPGNQVGWSRHHLSSRMRAIRKSCRDPTVSNCCQPAEALLQLASLETFCCIDWLNAKERTNDRFLRSGPSPGRWWPSFPDEFTVSSPRSERAWFLELVW